MLTAAPLQRPLARCSATPYIDTLLYVATTADASTYKSSALFQPTPSPSFSAPHSHSQNSANTNAAVCCAGDVFPVSAFQQPAPSSTQHRTLPPCAEMDPLKGGRSVYPVQALVCPYDSGIHSRFLSVAAAVNAHPRMKDDELFTPAQFKLSGI